MSQRTLFDMDAPAKTRKVARDSDPATSHMAAESTEESRKGAREVVLRIFSEHSRPMTSVEAAKWCYIDEPKRTEETYRKRVKEMADDGLLEGLGDRKCVVTGKMAQEYRKR